MARNVIPAMPMRAAWLTLTWAVLLAACAPEAEPGVQTAPRALRHGALAAETALLSLVLTPDGDAVPVLHRLSRRVPACGSFAPVRLRAPYFGLRQDITVAPSQRLVLSGSDVEYMFSQEAVLVEARHLVGGFAALAASAGPTITYTQLLLPEHEALDAAGCVAETLFVGRLRR